MKTKTLVLRIISIILGVLAYVSMAFPFVVTKTSRYFMNADTIHSSDNMSLSKWWEVLKYDGDKLWGWKISRVLMLIVLIVTLLILTTIVLKFFMKNKYIDIAFKYLALAGIILASLFIVFFFIGCVLQFGSSEIISTAVFPHAGSSILGISSLASSILALKSCKE